MKTRIAAAALIAALSQNALADNGNYWSNVGVSFDNMLNHTPYAGPTAVTVALGEPDPAETLIHAMVRGENQASYAEKTEPHFDTVGAAFDRMLNHTPHAGPTGITVARTLDHRVDRLVVEMRQGIAPSVRIAAIGDEGSIVK